MAEEQNHAVDTVAVPEIKDEAAPVLADETPATETAAAAPAADAEDKPAEDDKPAETEETGAAKEEVKPIEEGFLSHKATGSAFPKNLFPSRTHFFVLRDAVEAEFLAGYKKAEKHVETAHHNMAWAAHSTKGLLFVGEKKAPTNIINMSDAGDVEVDGNKSFFFTAKGHRHNFKAASEGERDSWVNLLKEKIAEAKELAATVTETEAYKQAMESFKPATPAAKEDKPEETNEEASKEDAPKEDAPKEEDAAAAGNELKADEPKKEARSASRKRASFFGFGVGAKKEEKEEAKEEEATASEAPVIDTVPEIEAPATEGAPAAEASAEDKPAAEEAQPDSPKDKVTKRLSLFGVFSKKEKKHAEAAKTEEAPNEEAETTDTAPVIPPVQATDPLAVDVSSPVAAPAETVESPVAATEPKKDTKEKRKSSLPFGLGKRDKSPAPPSESTFSKLRATIKGKGASKAEEKSGEEAAKEDEAANEGEPEAIKEETDADAAAAAPDATTEEAPKIEEAEPSKEDAPAAPAVTASA